MFNVMFVCLGNICRSPMAQFVFADMVKKANLQDKISVCSSGTSNEEQGNSLHYGARRKLAENGIPFSNHFAHKITDTEYENSDMIIVMENRNLISLAHRFGQDNKVFSLLEFCGGGDIADPWYSGNFDEAYSDIVKGCKALLEYLKGEKL